MYIVTDYTHVYEFQIIYRIAKVVLIIPVTKARPERCMCYEIDQDLLRKLLIISINNQGTNDKVQVIKIAVNVFRKYEYMNCCKTRRKKNTSVSSREILWCKLPHYSKTMPELFKEV